MDPPVLALWASNLRFGMAAFQSKLHVQVWKCVFVCLPLIFFQKGLYADFLIHPHFDTWTCSLGRKPLVTKHTLLVQRASRGGSRRGGDFFIFFLFNFRVHLHPIGNFIPKYNSFLRIRPLNIPQTIPLRYISNTFHSLKILIKLPS